MQEIAEQCRVFASDDLVADLSNLLTQYPQQAVFLLADEGSFAACADILKSIPHFDACRTIVIAQGDDNKNIDTVARVWQFLSDNGATRKSVLVNLGGGMPCDLGGFCASTFKRGIDFVNIPTTILAQVDASLGGKTGFNLGSLKNEIGVFSVAKAVVISPVFLKTLNHENFLSGFAEMLKHGLIADADYYNRLIAFDTFEPDYDKLHGLVCESIKIKNRVVEADPKENGLRKALNFGHTFGHAFETLQMRRHTPILHGYAVAYGMMCELIMSRNLRNLDPHFCEQACVDMSLLYGPLQVSEDDIDELVELMHHDKKNDGRGINFSLIPQAGQVEVNIVVERSEIEKALRDFLVINFS
ncbi:MAG: 3-dehydroquinate synthase [Bacteroidales bacterium]|nr:3-dehydroquinate synthase [Bacteroidales bacterium]